MKQENITQFLFYFTWITLIVFATIGEIDKDNVLIAAMIGLLNIRLNK